MTTIWIDTANGTWGEVESSAGTLVLVDLAEQARKDTSAGEPVDADSLVAFLEGASDGEISEYGLRHGTIASLPRPGVVT